MDKSNSAFGLMRACAGSPRLVFECGDFFDGAVNAVFICFRQEEFVAESFRSVLDQSWRLDIVALDDASDDQTLFRLLQVLREFIESKGFKHRVRVYQQAKNVGIVENIRSAFRALEIRAPVIIFEGDDVSRPNRVETLMALSAQNPDAWILGSGMALDGRYSAEKAWYQPEISSGRQRIGHGDWVVRACGMMVAGDFLACVDSLPRGLRTWDMAVNLILILRFGRNRIAVSHDLLLHYRILSTGETVTQSSAVSGVESSGLMKSAKNWLALSRLARREIARNLNVSAQDRADTKVLRLRWRAEARRLMILARQCQKPRAASLWSFFLAICRDPGHWRVYAAGSRDLLAVRADFFGKFLNALVWRL